MRPSYQQKSDVFCIEYIDGFSNYFISPILISEWEKGELVSFSPHTVIKVQLFGSYFNVNKLLPLKSIEENI